MSPPPHFHLISGNRLDALAAELGARLMRATDEAELLTPETVLVPQPALRQWLQHTLAERYGVAANLDLPTPSEFVWRLLRAASAAPLPEASPWDRERLRWRLYALLERLAAKDAAPPRAEVPAALRRYLQRSGNALQAARDGAAASVRFGLAERLAAAYDRYQAYRRDWLSAWERGEDRDDWQAVLWRSVCAEANAPHRAALIGDWLARYDRRVAGNDAPPPGLPARLAAFGTVHVSPDVLQMLAVAGQWCAVDFYLPTPSAEYWGDVESLRERLRRDGADALPAALADLQRDNPALTAWGGGGRDILAQVFSYETVQPQREVECFVDPGRSSVLRRLQQDVLQRAAPRAEAWSAGDGSVQIHACHSKLREVEVLHDRLRALLDDPRFEPPLQPREIAVMAPNIAEYLPLARAVFGGLDADDPRYIPFTLADRPQVQAHALIAWFLAMLELGDAPLRASGFRELLALPAAMRHLGLTDDDLARIDAWFAAAGIRWGEDAAARERAGVGRWREYSFDFGFERLLAGYAAGEDAGPWRMGADDALLRQAEAGAEAGADADDDQRIDNPWIAPYPELEGGDAEVLDRALGVYERLRALAAWMRTPHPAGDWRQRLSETVTALIGVHPQDSADAQARRWLLDALDTLAEDAADAGALPLAVVREALQAQLTQASAHQPWLAGGVTFAGMVPLRTVPFRAICLLGLDADAYPRREPAQDVDRLVDAVQGRAPRRLGDRSVREDDRFLFLQLLCAAGDVFYLSYGGRDARDGSVREPAAPIVELLDTLERMDGGCVTAADAQPRRLVEHVRFEHPLQPFSPRAFGTADGGRDARAFSYRSEWREDEARTTAVSTVAASIVAASTVAASTVPASAASESAALTAAPPFVAAPLRPRDTGASETPPDRDAILGFFLNPAKAWLETRLGLRFDSAYDAFDNREPLGENELQKYQLVKTLLQIDRDRFDADAPAMQASQASDSAAERLQAELPQVLRARAALAPGRDGQSMLDEALPVSRALSRSAREAIAAAAQTPPERISADAPIAFAFHDVRRGREGEPLRLIVEAGKLNGRRRLQAGLEHLLLASVFGETARTLLIGQAAAKPKSSAKTAANAPQPAPEDAPNTSADTHIPVEILVFGRVDAASAAARIRRLLELRREGEDAPLPFAPKAAWAYAEALAGKKPDPYAAWRAARDVFDYENGGEAYDPHIALAFRPDGLFDRFDSPRAQRFRALAVAVFDELLPAMAHTDADADAPAAAKASSRARKTPAGRKQ